MVNNLTAILNVLIPYVEQNSYICYEVAALSKNLYRKNHPGAKKPATFCGIHQEMTMTKEDDSVGSICGHCPLGANFCRHTYLQGYFDEEPNRAASISNSE